MGCVRSELAKGWRPTATTKPIGFVWMLPLSLSLPLSAWGRKKWARARWAEQAREGEEEGKRRDSPLGLPEMELERELASFIIRPHLFMVAVLVCLQIG